jgi:hypothetical protein
MGARDRPSESDSRARARGTSLALTGDVIGLALALSTLAAAILARLVVRRRAPPPARPEAAVAVAPRPAIPARYVCRRLQVLVVTPSPFVGAQIARMLSAHDVTVATSAQAALTRPPDAIVYTAAMAARAIDHVIDRVPALRSRMVCVLDRAPAPDELHTLAHAGVPWIAKPLRYAELATAVDLVAQAPHDHALALAS